MISDVLRAWYNDIVKAPSLKRFQVYIEENRELKSEYISMINSMEVIHGYNMTSRENIVMIINLALKNRNDKIKEYVK